MEVVTWLLAAATALAAPASSAMPVGTELAAAVPVVSVAPEPLTATAFKPFGELIEVPSGTTPTVESAVLRYWGGLAKARIHEELEFGMFTVKAREHEVAEMERHQRTPEFLIALGGEFLLAVAPPTVGSGGPVANRVRVFRVAPGQAVLLSRGTWHALPFPKADEGLFLVAFREGTATKDLTAKPLRGREVVKF